VSEGWGELDERKQHLATLLLPLIETRAAILVLEVTSATASGGNLVRLAPTEDIINSHGFPLSGSPQYRLLIRERHEVWDDGCDFVGFKYSICRYDAHKNSVRELWQVHWSPTTTSPFTYPHFHLQAQMDGIQIGKLHHPLGEFACKATASRFIELFFDWIGRDLLAFLEST